MFAVGPFVRAKLMAVGDDQSEVADASLIHAGIENLGQDPLPDREPDLARRSARRVQRRADTVLLCWGPARTRSGAFPVPCGVPRSDSARPGSVSQESPPDARPHPSLHCAIDESPDSFRLVDMINPQVSDPDQGETGVLIDFLPQVCGRLGQDHLQGRSDVALDQVAAARSSRRTGRRRRGRGPSALRP